MLNSDSQGYNNSNSTGYHNNNNSNSSINNNSVPSNLRRLKSVVGSPHYIAPEIANHGIYTYNNSTYYRTNLILCIINIYIN